MAESQERLMFLHSQTFFTETKQSIDLQFEWLDSPDFFYTPEKFQSSWFRTFPLIGLKVENPYLRPSPPINKATSLRKKC